MCSFIPKIRLFEFKIFVKQKLQVIIYKKKKKNSTKKPIT